MELVNEFRVALPVDEAWKLLTDPERIAPCMPGAQLLSVDGEDFHGAVKVKVGPIVAQYKGKATFQERDAAAHRAVIKADGKETRGAGNASAVVTMGLTPDGDGTAVHLVTDLTISGKAAQFGRGVLADVSGKLVTQFVRNLEADVVAAGTASPAAVPAGDASAPAAAAPAGPVASTAVPSPAIAAAGQPAAPPTAGAVATTLAPTDPATASPAAADTSATPAAPAPASSASTPGRAVPPRPVADAEPVSLLGVVAGPLAKRALPAVLGAAVVGLIIWLLARNA